MQHLPDEQLTHALLLLADQGRRPRCGDPDTHDMWTSDLLTDRRQAAAWCTGCPVLTLCANAGRAERRGVWGGIDRTVSTHQPARRDGPPGGSVKSLGAGQGSPRARPRGNDSAQAEPERQYDPVLRGAAPGGPRLGVVLGLVVDDGWPRPPPANVTAMT